MDMYPEKTIIQKDTCTPMFTAALLNNSQDMDMEATIPQQEEWLNTMWYIYKMGYYSAIKRNWVICRCIAWMDLETVIQSDVSQKKTKIIYMWNQGRW